jgi:hypothetical protein
MPDALTHKPAYNDVPFAHCTLSLPAHAFTGMAIIAPTNWQPFKRLWQHAPAAAAYILCSA